VARQKLGQHFLVRESLLNRIAAAACSQPEDLVIEIGPGRGALTRKLLERARRVIAIEIDPFLAAHLRDHFARDGRLEVVEADVLATDLTQWGRAPVVGNLPYYITSPILDRVLAAPPPRAVFLVQKEVAARLCAKTGTRDYGYLTVRTAFAASARKLFDVPPAAFHPPPKVDSAVVILEPHTPPEGLTDPPAFLRFLAQCFRYKRKTLRNNLAGLYARPLLDVLAEGSQRAEQLSLDDLLRVWRRLVQ